MKKQKAANNKNNKQPNQESILYKPWIHILIIVTITFLLYFPSLKNDFTNWDDHGYVLENDYVQHFKLSDISSAFKEPQVMGNYHPLAMVSLGIDHLFYNNNASGYHVTSLLFHLLNTVLLFLFVRALFGNVFIASLSAIIFAIHPLHVESVAWVSERKDVMYVFFFFAAANTWMKYLKSEKNKIIWFIATIILFLASLVSKGQAVTFSVMLVLIDFVLEKKYFPIKNNLKLYLEKIPFFSLSLIFGIIAIKAQQLSEAIHFIPFYSWTDKILFACYALFSYISKFIIPHTLSAFHPYPLKNGEPYSLIIYASPIILILLASFLIYYFRKNKIVWFGIGIFMVNIALVLQLLPVGNAIYAERYTYLSYTGLIVMFAYGIVYLSKTDNQSLKKFYRPSLLITVLLLFFFSYQTYSRSMVWKNSEVLWLNVLSNYNYAPNANNNLGSYYQKNDQLDKAKYYFDSALRFQNDFVDALINRSDIYRVSGKLDSAIADCNHAIAIDNKSDAAYVNRGISLSIAGKYDDALKDFNTAISLNPKIIKPYSNRANLLALKGDFENSLKDYATVIEKDPYNADAYSNRARTLLTMKKLNEAKSDIDKAISLDTDNGNFYLLRADINNNLGKYQDALNDINYATQYGNAVNPEFIKQLQLKIQSQP